MKHIFPVRAFSVAALSLLLCEGVFAQTAPKPEPDKIGLTLATGGTSSGNGRLKAGGESFDHVQINNSTTSVSQALGLGEAGSLAFNITYNRTDIDEGNRRHHERDYSADRVPLPNELQALGADLEYSAKINANWALATAIGGTSHVAKHQLLSKGWGVNAHALTMYTYSPDLTLAFGLAYDSLSEDWKCVPIFGFEWKPAKKWSVAIGFPKTAVSYELRPNLTLAMAVSGDGGTYYIKDDPRPGTAPRSLANSKLEYTEARLGLQAEWRINRTFALSGALGSVLYREFKYIDRGYKLKAHDTVPFMTLAFSASL